MERLFNIYSIIAGIAGGFIAAIFGAWDVLLWALIVVMALDYATGIIKAIHNNNMSSRIGKEGILKKISILAVVALANVAQVVTGGHVAIREIVIMFYIANEGISILENVAEVSPNIPDKLKDILLQLRDKEEKKDEDITDSGSRSR